MLLRSAGGYDMVLDIRVLPDGSFGVWDHDRRGAGCAKHLEAIS